MAGTGLSLVDSIGPVGRDRFALLVGDADGCPYALPGVSEPPEFRVPMLKRRWAERMIADGSVLWRLRVGARGLELDEQEHGGLVRRGPVVADRALGGAYPRL
eukprot:3829521-Alexandrium_andersonii.AAC.1